MTADRDLWAAIGRQPGEQATPAQLVAYMRQAPDEAAEKLATQILALATLGAMAVYPQRWITGTARG